MFRVTTYVTSSPQTSRRRRSAAAKTRCASSPRAASSRVSSSSPSSSPDELERRRVAADDERDARRLARAPTRRRARARSRPRHGARTARRPGRPSARARRRTRGRAASRGASSRPRLRVASASRSISGHGASGLTWSIVTGETPPQSSMPASSRRGKSSKARFGGACTCHAGPSRMRATAIVHRWSSSDGSGCEAMRVPGFARKFWTMTSCTCPCSSPSAFRASSASIRSSRVSPIPMRIPLVNGIESSPASRIVSRRRAGNLVRRGPVRPAPLAEPLGGRLEHDPHRRRDRPQRLELRARHHAGVQVRQQAGLLEHEPRAAREVLERRLAAERAQLLARDLVAELGLVAEREERLAAARRRARARDREHLVLGHDTRARRAAAGARTCSSRRRRGRASSAG